MLHRVEIIESMKFLGFGTVAGSTGLNMARIIPEAAAQNGEMTAIA